MNAELYYISKIRKELSETSFDQEATVLAQHPRWDELQECGYFLHFSFERY